LSGVSVRTLGVLQWVGLLLGAGIWLSTQYIGYAVAEATCGVGSSRWDISHDEWQSVLMSVALVVVLAAETCSVAVFRRTRSAGFGDDPPREGRAVFGALPYSRIHFFATGAIVANALFAIIIVLAGTATIVNHGCTQA
jgi:hypothetical protein